MTKEERLLKALGLDKKENKILSTVDYTKTEERQEAEKDKEHYKAIAKAYNIKTTHELALFRIKQQCCIIIDFIDNKSKDLPSIQKALTLDRMIATLRTNYLKLIDKNQNIEDILNEKNGEKKEKN